MNGLKTGDQVIWQSFDNFDKPALVVADEVTGSANGTLDGRPGNPDEDSLHIRVLSPSGNTYSRYNVKEGTERGTFRRVDAEVPAEDGADDAPEAVDGESA